MIWSTAALSYVLVVAWLAYSVAQVFCSPLRRLPGPWYTLFTRVVLKYKIITGSRMHYVHALHQKYGPIVRIAPNDVAVADPEAFVHIHRIGSGFLKAPWYAHVTAAQEPGIFAMIDPKAHAQRRRLFAKSFTSNSLQTNWETTIREKVDFTVKRIRGDAAANGGEVDVLKWWMFMATDVIGHLSFGESFDMLKTGKKTEYIKAVESALINSGIRYEVPWLHALLRMLPIPSIRVFINADKYVMHYGKKAVNNLRSGNSSSRNLFSTILAASDNIKEGDQTYLSDQSIQLEAGNLIVAGSDTTSITITYLVWAVLKRPELQRRLEAEVAALPGMTADGNPGFTSADLERLPLLNAVIDESLRLYGAAPGSLPRSVPPGGATLCGYALPGGTVVETQAYTLHRDARVFPDPLRFDETRFLDGNLTPQQRKVFCPFGAGTRVCIGLHLARIELLLAAATFFRECRGATLGKTMTDSVMDMDNHFLIAPAGHRCTVVVPP
ncbi:hypothetical protein SBRCBS47491_006416 [Sporothrix bragantina]|uniref:Cytochrome P450 n=1 Tax=Sporothrix bragantina TaxID=671064 RepID=A0ABP0C4R7_9PEZI